MIRRLFGFSADTIAGGSSYDDLVSGAIPDADTFWPVTGGTLDKNLERYDREAEVRGRRPRTAPLPFRSGPQVTVPVPAYRLVLEKGLRKVLGATDQVTGTPPAAVTHRLDALGYGSTELPAVHAQLVRDDINHKIAGCSFNRVSLSFPLDGEGTCEFELWGTYYKHDAAAVPTATFTGFDDVFMLRDAQVVIDGAGSPIPDLQGFEWSFVNNLQRKWYAKKNVVSQVIGTPSLTRKVWYPGENKLGAAQDVNYALNFGNTNTAQELAQDFGQIQKFVFEVAGGPLGTTPPATELLRITIFAGEHTDGGAEALSARDDITTRLEGGSFYSTADSADSRVEIVNSTSALLT